MAVFAMFFALCPRVTIFGMQQFLVAEISQGILIVTGPKNYIAAVAAVPTVRTSFVDKFLMTKTKRAIAAVAGSNFYIYTTLFRSLVDIFIMGNLIWRNRSISNDVVSGNMHF
jgi:hypothetical protein